VKVIQNAYAWSTPGNTKYVIFKYKIINTGVVQLDNLYAGVFADWDIMNSNLNKAAYDAPNKMGYCYSTQTNGLFAGIKLLSNTAPAVHYAMDNTSGGGGGIDPTGGISTDEKFTGISTNRTNAGGTGNGNDVNHFVSSGPFILNPNDTAEVAFAYIAGDSLIDLQNSAAAAQIKYENNPIIVKNIILNEPNFSLYPNPANDILNIIIAKNDYTNYTIKLFDIHGKVMGETICNKYNETTKLSLLGIENGVYFIQVITGTKVRTEKFILTR